MDPLFVALMKLKGGLQDEKMFRLVVSPQRLFYPRPAGSHSAIRQDGQGLDAALSVQDGWMMRRPLTPSIVA